MSYDFTKIPFDRIVHLGHRSMLQRDLFVVSWILGRFCNYNCSYCWPYANGRVKDHRPTELCLSTIDEIKRQARENGFNSFHFSLSGGEPTFHPGFLDIIEHLANDKPNTNFTSTHMTSNCSQNMKFFEKYVHHVKKLDQVAVTASFHIEHLDTQGKIKNFADKLEFLQDNGVFVIINIVMVPKWFYQLYEAAEYFHSRNLNPCLKPQSNETASKVVDGYTQDMLDKMQKGMPLRNRIINSDDDELHIEMIDDQGNKWYMDQAERFNAFNFNNFEGWKCHSGYQSCIIREPDGSIKRSYSCKDVPLGYIDKGFQLFKEPTICISPACVSSADSKITKFRDV